MGGNAEIDEHYRPRRHSLRAALARVGTHADDIGLVANCHLHFDHCGGNPELAGRPIFTQAVELKAARSGVDYTLAELVDGPALTYEEITGEAEVLPGVLLVPTPGHTAGHQSIVVRRRDGTVILAGQARDSASEYSADVLAQRAQNEGHGEPLPMTPQWIARLQRLDPARVLFAHDHAGWIPD
jgi:N-acyl homoserine lactone hydrolase